MAKTGKMPKNRKNPDSRRHRLRQKRLAFELAKTLDAEIISVDSMKVYRRMDIGTAKPPLEKRKILPYHLVDVAEPSEAFSVDRFLDLTQRAVSRHPKPQ